jgi:hypothetical protein
LSNASCKLYKCIIIYFINKLKTEADWEEQYSSFARRRNKLERKIMERKIK